MTSSNFKEFSVQPPTFPDPEKKAPKKGVKLLISIVDRGKGEGVVRLLERHGSLFHTIVLGRGTARKNLLDYLGLGETEKDLVLSGVSEINATEVVTYLTHAMQFDSPGRGIAFTLPISSVSGRRALDYLTGNPSIKEDIEQSEVPSMVQFEHSLIISIVNRGFTDLVIDAAIDAGARGGTIIHARGAGLEEASDFFGISIVPEKEVVLILANTKERNPIMQSIINASGLSTPAHGISFSVPVDNALGMAQMMTEKFDKI